MGGVGGWGGGKLWMIENSRYGEPVCTSQQLIKFPVLLNSMD